MVGVKIKLDLEKLMCSMIVTGSDKTSFITAIRKNGQGVVKLDKT